MVLAVWYGGAVVLRCRVEVVTVKGCRASPCRVLEAGVYLVLSYVPTSGDASQVNWWPSFRHKKAHGEPWASLAGSI
jgi:hypothetical protein